MKLPSVNETANVARDIYHDLFTIGLIVDYGTILNAASFMYNAHYGQTRKYVDKPYYHHCVDVAKLVWSSGHDETSLISALLHDTIEDTSVKYSDIEYNFGYEVANIVQELTHIYTPESYPLLVRKERKKLEIDRLAKCSYSARCIKVADRVSNLVDLTKDALHNEEAAKFLPTYKAESMQLFSVLNVKSPIMLLGWKLAGE